MAVLSFMSPVTSNSKMYGSSSQNMKTISELRTASITYSARDPKLVCGMLSSVYKISFLGKLFPSCISNQKMNFSFLIYVVMLLQV